MENPRTLDTVKEVLDAIAREFSYSFGVKAPALGRTLGEIEASKKFIISDRCTEESILIASRLKKAEIETEIVQKLKKNALGIPFPHFSAGFAIGQENYEIGFNRGYLRVSHATYLGNKPGVTRLPFNLRENQSLADMVDRKVARLAGIRKAWNKVRPRAWPLPVNRRKDQKKLQFLNDALKRRIVK